MAAVGIARLRVPELQHEQVAACAHGNQRKCQSGAPHCGQGSTPGDYWVALRRPVWTRNPQREELPFMPFVIPLSHVRARDLALVGGKAARLAQLAAARLTVPAGFVVTMSAFTEAAGDRIIVGDWEVSAGNQRRIQAASEALRAAVHSLRLPGALAAEVRAALDTLNADAVSVRSSATAEDREDASFAGQYQTFLNVRGAAAVLRRIKDVWASYYSPGALGYQIRHGADQHVGGIAAQVQEQLAPDVAGVLFTRDPISGRNRFVVNAALGLGEGAVAGSTPITSSWRREPATPSARTCPASVPTSWRCPGAVSVPSKSTRRSVTGRHLATPSYGDCTRPASACSTSWEGRRTSSLPSPAVDSTSYRHDR